MVEIEKVIVTKGKLDTLANSISAKSGESLPMTITEMISAVDGIASGDGSVYETYFDGSITAENKEFYIASLADLHFANGETWRVTWDGVEYTCQTAIYEGWLWTVGNQTLPAGTDDGTGEPFCLYNYDSGFMAGNARTAGTHTLKLEKQTSSGSGSSANLGTKTITVNGTYSASNDSLDGYSEVTVNIPATVPNLQSKTVTPTESIQTITADSTYDGLSSVEVGAIDSEYIGSEVTRISNNSGITINGNTVSVAGQAYWTGNVSKTIPLQSKTATPTESIQTITADSDYSGLSSVEIGAVSSTYVGSEITRRSSSNLTASGSTVTVPAGYYAESASKSVATATHANPTASINSTTGLITASHTQTAGYVSAGTTTDTLQLTTQDAKTVTPTESSQTAVAAGVYTTGTVTIGAISSTYVGSDITQRNGDDLTVNGATVTVPTGYYSSQTTKSVANGSTGTPTATKGTVSNHSITVTPSVTNTTGYITGGTKTGTAITVTASELASGNKEIISNGTNIDVVGYSTVSVAIPPNEPNLQAKTDIVPSTSSQTITPDNGYDGLSSVQIDAMPNGSVSTPATTITANPSISINTSGLITATTSVSQEIIPTVSAGYVSAGTSGTVTVSGSNTQQLTTLDTTTYNTSTTDQTITSGKYITGTQTIKAVTISGLSAENIANGVTVKVGDANDDDRIVSVTGTLAFQTIHTGSSTPSSSLGNNGDIYIQS